MLIKSVECHNPNLLTFTIDLRVLHFSEDVKTEVNPRWRNVGKSIIRDFNLGLWYLDMINIGNPVRPGWEKRQRFFLIFKPSYSPNINQAIQFMFNAHKDQQRKYSDNVPYALHPLRVAYEVYKIYPNDEELVIASLLHDVVEDCGVSFKELEEKFGYRTSKFVEDLTNISKYPEFQGLNRTQRKKLDLIHINQINNLSKTVKLIDRIDNLKDMPMDNQEAGRFYKKKYSQESKDLLNVLRGVNSELEERLENLINEKDKECEKLW